MVGCRVPWCQQRLGADAAGGASNGAQQPDRSSAHRRPSARPCRCATCSSRAAAAGARPTNPAAALPRRLQTRAGRRRPAPRAAPSARPAAAVAVRAALPRTRPAAAAGPARSARPSCRGRRRGLRGRRRRRCRGRRRLCENGHWQNKDRGDNGHHDGVVLGTIKDH